MPTLNWIGKEAVVEHHLRVPTRLLECDRELSVGDPEAENLLVEGDNLEALKACCRATAGRSSASTSTRPTTLATKTGSTTTTTTTRGFANGWADVVGKEAEDLCRHDKWLCMMYPRLALLREFLREDGAIFVSIADHEVHNLRHLLDEVFGAELHCDNYVAEKTVAAERRNQPL